MIEIDVTPVSKNEALVNEIEPESLIKWMGRNIRLLKNMLDPKLLLIKTLAYCLFPLAARCVVFTSTRSFKKRCQPERLNQSRQTLRELGGQEISLRMPDGHSIFGMYLDARSALNALIAKGGERGTIPVGDNVQQVLWISPAQPELWSSIERMGIEVHEHQNRSYIKLGIPKQLSDAANSGGQIEAGTLIYGPGSGHQFEFRRKTLGAFLFGYGMNVLVFHYSGTGESGGKISEQATYENVEGAYQYLREKGISDEKILGYGHCMGGGPVLDLAANHPHINVLADRTYTTMGEFCKHRATRLLYLPRFLHFLTSWIEPVMNKCFYYNNREKIKQVSGHFAILEASRDDLIVSDYIQELFDNAVLARSRLRLLMDSNHDMDLVPNEATRLSLGQFLTATNLIGY
ncbi:alpha/beta hydrolase [Candidatus Protochlamydia phocaeensis]|uniref:alpha/beta hydrolase n=1 Tax=Candidatus Protochlamydia phocaeensis TaxID=1414722 RepID=UPI000837E9B7|nr:alpha/beta hydrolase [Candidatus Protochlamydia phocaeensis]